MSESVLLWIFGGQSTLLIGLYGLFLKHVQECTVNIAHLEDRVRDLETAK